jgi:hypothetical protein
MSESVEDAETETAADMLTFGRFRAESEGALAADFFLRAAEAESAPLKCVLMSLEAMIDFALSHYLLDVGFVGWRICSLN